MSDSAELLQSILEAPDDNAPRIAFAEWLEANGQPERAQLIRVQVARARDGVTPDSPRYAESRRREIELFTAMRKRKVDPPSPVDEDLPDIELGFPERGFAESVTFLSPKAFTKNAKTIFANLPIREMVLKVVDDAESEWTGAALEKALASPLLVRSTRLICDGVQLAGSIKNIAGSKHLAKLEFLSLRQCGLGTADVKTLTGSKSLPETLHVDLRDNDLKLTKALAEALKERFRQVEL